VMKNAIEHWAIRNTLSGSLGKRPPVSVTERQ
jgi:hypothetical protein